MARVLWASGRFCCQLKKTENKNKKINVKHTQKKNLTKEKKICARKKGKAAAKSSKWSHPLGHWDGR